jgi:hypothetical protein
MRLQKEQLWVSGFYSGQLYQVEKEQRFVVVAAADRVVVASMVPWLLGARGRKKEGSAKAVEQELNPVWKWDRNAAVDRPGASVVAVKYDT